MAVEFALLAGPFLLLLMGILELATIFAASATIDAATAQTTRDVLVGRASIDGDAAAGLRTQICARMMWLADDCPERLTVEVESFAQAAVGANPILVFRVSYPWPVVTPVLAQSLATDPAGTVQIVVGAALRLERVP